MGEYFFIVGAQRSGTSYLYQILANYPEIEMAQPARPEPKFFHIDSLFEHGLEYYKSRFFGHKTDAWLRGEKSTCYIESEKAARRIAYNFPEAKIIFLLRDPIERAISNYWFSVNSGLETRPMAEAFWHEDKRRSEYDHERVSVSPYAYLKRGRYIDYIDMYENYFPIENIKVILYEQFIESSDLVRDIYAFLGVAPDFMSATLDRVINKGNKPNSTFSPDLKHYLMDYFSESNARLAKRFKLALTEWRSYEEQLDHTDVPPNS